ncbi:superinfection immunity protein [Pseudomonas aeruginosa]|uniref:superinfection immunity protein n=1 Tax=Pseudomonas aeruginosa TaxID=287 RepID=UPI002A6A6266|nr:superinfection immunity protein [Pseudomonas aeruginosa]MDY1128518.1 superinfection immunity protein [Pseudomonas aeruginosa]HCK4428441.1 superinfection immunity protein [Pseudomonas aeruginosa]
MENGSSLLLGFIFLMGGLILYFLPAIIAENRRHHNKGAIIVLNLFLGWTFVGWVAALVWAASSTGESERGGAVSGNNPNMQTQANELRPCPYCAEMIKCAAIKCRYCGADIDAVPEKPAPVGLSVGWAVKVKCKSAEDIDSAMARFDELKLPVASVSGLTVIVGPFPDKRSANSVLRALGISHHIHGDLYWIKGR